MFSSFADHVTTAGKGLNCYTVSVAQPIIAFVDMLDCAQEVFAVLVVFKDKFLFITARRDVIHRTGVFYAKWSCHKARIALLEIIVNGKDLTLYAPKTVR